MALSPRLSRSLRDGPAGRSGTNSVTVVLADEQIPFKDYDGRASS